MKANSPMNSLFRRGLQASMMAGVLAATSIASAAVIVKTNNATALNVAGAWTNNVVPGALDIAQFDNATASATTNLLGANMSWGGITVIDPASPVNIRTGSTLTLGAGGINMTAATQDLVLSNAVTVGPAYQKWSVAAGRVLKTGAAPSKPSGNTTTPEGIVEFSTTGTINLSAAATAVIVDPAGNPWATYGLADFAGIDASGNVVAATYSPWTASVGTAFSGNVADVQANFTQSGNGGFNGVRFADPANVYTVTLGSSTTFSGRGVLMTPSCAGGVITGGFFRPNRNSTVASTSFDFIQNSTVGDLTVGANIPNGSSGAPVRLVKAGPGKMILTVANGYTGGTMIFAGTLQVNSGAALGATAGAGAVVVNGGRLIYQSGANQGLPSVTVNNASTNGISVVTANGSSFIGTNLFLAAGTTRLEFSWNTGIALSAVTAPMQVSTLTNSGTAVIDIFSAGLAVGQYPLIKYTAAGGAGNYVIGSMPLRTSGRIVTNSVNNTIDLVVDSVNQPIYWATGSGNWDLATTANWITNGVATTYQQVSTVFGSFGDVVQFEDSFSGGSPITVTLNANLAPGSVTVANSTKTYTISGSGSITGSGSLTKVGNGTLTLGTANSFKGGLNLNGGTTSFSSLTNLGGGAISFGGGTLQYNGNNDDISVRTVTLNTGGATIDTAGNSVNFASPIGNSGAGGLTKSGLGTLTLNGTNRYSGNTVVANGTLALGANTFISNSPAIIVNSGATLDASASGLAFKGSPVQTLAGVGSISGSLISSNGIITPNTNGLVGTLTFNNDLTISGGSLVLDLSTNASQRDLITVAGTLNIYGGTLQLNVAGVLTNGSYKLIQYGTLGSGAGSSANLVVSYSQVGKAITLSDATAGEINLVVADTASDNIVWSGPGGNWDTIGSVNWLNGATPWAFTNGDLVTFDEIGVASAPTISLQNILLPSSVVVSNQNTYTFNDGTGVGGGKISGATSIVKKGSGTLIIATPNNNSGPTDIRDGTLQIGNGGSAGDLGSGTVTNNGSLVFAQTDNHVVSGVISGSGQVMQQGSGIVSLAANNTYSGPTIITSGSLQVGTGGASGSLGSGSVTNDGTLIYNRSGTLTVGNIKTGPANQGALTFSGSATVTLNGGNDYINNTTVNGGLVKLSGVGVIPSAASVPGSTGWLVLDGGTTAGVLDINGFDLTVNALSGNAGAVNGIITNSGTSTATTNTLTILGSASPTYFGAIADNATGSKTKVVVLGAGSYRPNGNNTYTGGTFVGDTATFIFANGASFPAGSSLTMSNNTTFNMLQNGGSANPSIGIQIPAGAKVNMTSGALGNGYSGLITGGADTTNFIAGPISFSAANTKQLANMLGTVWVSTGYELRFSSTSGINNGGDNTTFLVDGTLHMRNAGAASLGALNGTGTIDAMTDGPSTGTCTYTIGLKGTDAVFSGTISDNAGANKINAIVKSGSGLQVLDGVLAYTGATTINGGVLKIASVTNPNSSLNSVAAITVTSNAVLDVSDRIDGALNLGNAIAQTLTGYGTIRGSLNEAANSAVNVGLGILNITNVATLNGTLNMQLNRTNAITASKLIAGTIVNASALTVTNVGPALQGGDTFTLFSGPVTGFTATNLPALTGTLYWTNNLAVNGTIAVVNPVATNPTNITASVSGNVLSLSWPADHTGWKLQIQTNGLATGLNTNWVTLPGSDLVNSTNLTINPANGAVFYRMVYP